MRSPRAIAFVLSFGLAVAAGALAEEEEAPKGPKELHGLKYRLIGPAAGGRVSRVAGVPGDPLTYYAATASGGVWKSIDGGIALEADLRRPADASIGSIAVAPSDPERRLRRLGRGEHPRQRRAGQRHLQVDRRRQDLEARLEAGRPDRHDDRPPREPRHRLRGRARPAPSAPTRSAASTARSDGGKTWQQVLTKDADTGASDVAFDPHEPATSSSPGCGRRGAGRGS